MVNEKQLMLGDYFLVGDKYHKRYMYAVSINSSYIMFDFIGNDGFFFECKKDYIEPILITEDLLKEIGINNTDSCEYIYSTNINKWNVSLSRMEDETFNLRFYQAPLITDVRVKYLHELQQAVRLITKEELKIEL